ncbi:MAG: glycosyltransferase family 4 protein [Bacteroidota bacterium]
MHFGVLSDPTHFHTKKWVKGLLEAGQQVSVFSFVEGEIPGANCVKIEARYALRGTPTYLSFLYSGKRLAQALEEVKVDILNPINMTPYGVWGRKANFHPMVSIAMGADILEYPPRGVGFEIADERRWGKENLGNSSFIKKFIQTQKRAFFRKEVDKALKASDFITGDNLLLVHAVRDWFGIEENKVALNRWGVEEELFEMDAEAEADLRQKYKIAPGQKLVLSPRGMKPLYQGDIICEAFEYLLRKGREEKFLMLSAGYEVPAELDMKAKDLMAEFPNFHYQKEVIPREEACQLWNLSEVFVSAPIYDGYSNALSEGRYMGAIPVVNDIPATRELLLHRENAWMVDPFEVDELSSALEEILNNSEAWKEKFAPKNRKWILENAHLKSNMKAFVEACEKLL